jgi:hypothetical protein
MCTQDYWSIRFFSITHERNKVNIVPLNNTAQGFTMSFQEHSRSSTLLMPCNPQRIGDINDTARNESGSTSAGTHTPPTADIITTEIAATGKA